VQDLMIIRKKMGGCLTKKGGLLTRRRGRQEVGYGGVTALSDVGQKTLTLGVRSHKHGRRTELSASSTAEELTTEKSDSSFTT